MIVVGGVYREVCQDPEIDNLFGSGLRAAFALARGCDSLELMTVACREEIEELTELAKAFGFTTSLRERSYPIQYHYDVPVSSPRLLFPGSAPPAVEKIEASGHAVLVFGMLEAMIDVSAERLVVDPQGLKELEANITWSAKDIAIVGNRTEFKRFAGDLHEGDLPDRLAKHVLKEYGANVVVMKCGALGSVVAESSSVSHVGAFPTAKVNPIGSGDIFSAVFAFYWAERGYSPVQSARLASKATAAWVSGDPFQVVDRNGKVTGPEIDNETYGEAASVYIAAPFFSVAERWLLHVCRGALMDLGATVFSPYHDVGWGPPELVAPADLEGLRNADSVLALLDGFDSGTLFEVGHAVALDIPVAGFVSERQNRDLTMLNGSGVRIYEELSSAIYNAIWQGLLHTRSQPHNYG